MQPQTITPKQQTILHYLYLYRFLTSQQLQVLLGHSSKYRIGAWLKALREMQYIGWQYTASQYKDRSKPAVYFLVSGGIHHLGATSSYPRAELRLRYSDSRRNVSFIENCIFLAGRAVQLISLDHVSDDGRPIYYSVLPRAALADPAHPYHEVIEDAGVRPQLVIIKRVESHSTLYFLELFPPTTPRYAVRRKLKAYVQLLGDQDTLPEGMGSYGVLLVLPNRSELLAAQRAARSMVGDAHHALCLFTTVDQLERKGIDSDIWAA